MAQIGTFTRGEDGSYTGTIKTLSLNIKVRFVPAEPSQNEKAPDLRVLAGNVEIGAAWKRTSKENTVYHSVKLDDPSFPAPIYANLVEVEGGLRARLVALIRPAPRAAAPQAPRLSSPGIMRSAATSKRPKKLRSHDTAPHNVQLRIIGFMRCTA